MLAYALIWDNYGMFAALICAVASFVFVGIGVYYCGKKAKTEEDYDMRRRWKKHKEACALILVLLGCEAVAVAIVCLLTIAHLHSVPNRQEEAASHQTIETTEVTLDLEDDEAEDPLDSDTAKAIFDELTDWFAKDRPRRPNTMEPDSKLAEETAEATVQPTSPSNVLTFKIGDEEYPFRIECGYQWIDHYHNDNVGVEVITLSDGFYVSYDGPHTWGLDEQEEFEKRFERALTEHGYWWRPDGLGWMVFTNPEVVDAEYTDQLRELAEDIVKDMAIPKEYYPWELKKLVELNQ